MSLLKKLGMSLASFGLAFALNLESRLYAKDIYVPLEYRTIQAAIDANDTDNGDRILVAPGEYIINEPITYRGKNIILKSEEGAQNTIVRMSEPTNPSRSSVFIFENGEMNNAILEGFTITGGGNPNGGGVLCEASSPIIKNSIILENGVGAHSPYSGMYGVGGGIFCNNSSAIILNNTIEKNESHTGGGIMCLESIVKIIGNQVIENYVDPGGGGGIYCYNCEVIIEDNIILKNKVIEYSGGGIVIYDSNAIIKKNIIANNVSEFGRGGGIHIIGSNSTIDGNVIIKNTAQLEGGGIFFKQSKLTLINSILYDNEGQREYDNLYHIESPQPIITYCNFNDTVYCNQNGNICADPLFADPNNDDYHLKSQAGRWDPKTQRWVQDDKTSPCIDAGDPRSPIMYESFPNGGRINMGAYGGTKEASKSYFGKPNCETIVAGDINGDCKVDFKDFAIMGYHWLEDRGEE